MLSTYIYEYVSTKHGNRQIPQRNWTKNLPELQAALNSVINMATGYSPHRLLFGTELCLDGRLRPLSTPGDFQIPLCTSREEHFARLADLKNIYERVMVKLKEAYSKNARVYNLRRRDVTFKEGQRVFRRHITESDASKYFSKKLAPKFIGPFTIKS